MPRLHGTAWLPRQGRRATSAAADDLHEPPLRRPERQLVPSRQLELAQHRRDVRLDRLHRDRQLPRDFLVRVPACDQAQHLPLPSGELVQLRVDGDSRSGSRHPREGVEHEPGQPRREHGVAARDPEDGVDQLGTRDRLGHVPACAGPDHRDHVLGRVRHAQREEPDVERRPAHLLDHGLPASEREVHVEEDHVGESLEDHLDGGSDLVGLAHHLDGVAELGAHAGAKEVVVVDQEHPGAPSRPGRSGAQRGLTRATLSSTSVPAPGDVRTTARPPLRCIRATIDWAMPRRSGVTAPRSNPEPRSRTNTDTRSSSTSANRDTDGAPDHLAAFTVASRAASRRARIFSSSSQSPTTTSSTTTPWDPSTSAPIARTPEARSVALAHAALGTSPSKSHARSSRSWPRASWTTRPGSAAARWISASVRRTESWTLAATSARSSARTRAWRSAMSSRASLIHHGPKSTTAPTRSSATPPAIRAMLTWTRWRVISAMPAAANPPPSPMRRANRRRVARVADPTLRTGAAAACSHSRSSGSTLRHTRTPPAAQRKSGHAAEVSAPTCSAPATTSMTTSAGRKARARTIPWRSFTTRAPMLSSCLSSGMSSHAPRSTAAPKPPNPVAA